MLKKNKYRLMVMLKLKPIASGVKRFIVINFILSLIVIALNFILPYFYKIFIEQVILQGKITVLGTVIIGYLSIHGLNMLIDYIKNYGNNRIVNRINYRLKLKIWKGLFKQDFAEYERKSVGDTKMRFEEDVNAISPFAGYQTIEYIISYITLVISLILLFMIEWRLAIFSLLAIPITFIIDHLLSKREMVLNDEQRENDQKMSTWLHTSIQGWKEIKALNLENNQKIRFVRFIRKYALYYAKWINYWTVRALILPKIRDEFFMKFGLYFLGGLLIIYEGFKVSDLLIFAMYYGILSTAINTVSTTDAELQTQMPYINRVMEELDKVEAKAEKNDLVLDGSNTITFDNVCFRYPNSERDIINHLNLQVNKGERVAITGKSGSGKTTILKLMTGLVKPTAGNVLFSGVNLSDVNISKVHDKIGFVMQENVLFNTSIVENLLFGKRNAIFDELVSACKKAYIYDFINSLPEGFDTIIGERGVKLSGGQRQRLILARLFLREVDIFIFDEATSALDQYSESIVHDAINSIPQDKTIIVVAHRASSISLCDRNIVLEEVS
ncbi:ATP-binding cassette subfamily B protein/subfamily B ATP-binding cassette protein MsbA [Paenibacillus sp. DS2015]|uniref:ABC transporter ATP-binding protein n=1 Tax=Paenibacillus sp. DS2015 TaxID=3373917 RepID=UPI003D1E6739